MAAKRKSRRRELESAEPKELLLPREVQGITRLSETTIARLRAKNRFPQPITIGFKRIAWRAADIYAWIAAGGAAGAAQRGA
jgi:prophage regulatory protein